MRLEEWIELRREARESGWDICVLEMFLTVFHLHHGRDATVVEVREFFHQGSKEVEQAAE